ncbi:MAG: hypothetical protein Q4F29_05385 [Lachnospiraceae bacterium]|nr:hypothetical protein [Lachnospiraceae bacterium]
MKKLPLFALSILAAGAISGTAAFSSHAGVKTIVLGKNQGQNVTCQLGTGDCGKDGFQNNGWNGFGNCSTGSGNCGLGSGNCSTGSCNSGSGFGNSVNAGSSIRLENMLSGKGISLGAGSSCR